MIVSSPARAVGAAVLVGGLLLGGCSSEKDVPPTVASAPNGGTQVNTDTGSGGTFPDINSVPNQRPTSTIQDLNAAPEGLSGAPGGGQYGDALVGGPTSSAPPPAPPPPPPPEQQLAPIAESADQTQNASIPTAPAPTPAEPAAEAPADAAAPAPEEVPEPAGQEAAAPEESPAAPSEPIATPEVNEPEPMEPGTEGEPQYGEAAPAPEPAAPAPQDQGGEGQTIVAQAPQTQPAVPAADAAAAPAPAPESTPPAQPETQVAAAPPAPAPSATALPQTAPAYSQSYPVSSPEAYGISPPNPASPPYRPAGNSGAANYAAAAPSPPYATHGEPLGLIYFGEGSYALSPDDRDVLVQIANMQRIYGGVVHVVGHASTATGAAEANQRISAARAQAVADQLMQYGVPRDAIQVIAAGDAQPLYSETAPSGEAGDRRADVYLGAY
ncbi:MAG TPA: OmpA family protein [Dongiaceae bacterium]